MLTDWFLPWWPDVGAFFAMGKHGAYVWGSVAACVVALVAEQAMLAGQARRWQRQQALMLESFSKEKWPLSIEVKENIAMKVEA